MDLTKTPDINVLVGRFLDLQEEWENNPAAFDWSALQALAQEGAHAYNEGAGLSFHMLTLDGVEHGEFHERFLNDSLAAGFDPFKLVNTGSSSAHLPVFNHAGLAEAADANAASKRMRAALMQLASDRFTATVEQIERNEDSANAASDQASIVACSDSVPPELFQRYLAAKGEQ